jgi:hypothetical protein
MIEKTKQMAEDLGGPGTEVVYGESPTTQQQFPGALHFKYI